MSEIKKIKRIVLRLECMKKYGIGYVWAKIAGRIGINLKKDAKGYIYDYYSKLDQSNYKKELKFWYETTTWKELNLDSPRSFNEKLQWLKLHDNTKKKRDLADKYKVRDWIKEQIGEKYLVDLLGVWNSFDEIDFDKLPQKFVLKCNHGSGMNVVVKEKKDLNLADLKEKFDRWMTIDFAACNMEPQYHGIERKIIAEEYLTNYGDDLYDYKFWCNNGKCDFIMFLSERKAGLKMANYDKNWNLLPFVYDHEQCNSIIEKPDNLQEMIELAEKLAKEFYHVRVDFYRLNDGTIKFGEMTFTSMSGVQKWVPEEANYFVGELMHLPIDESGEFV